MYICECGKNCKSKAGLTTHKKTCYKFNEYKRICPSCGKEIIYKTIYNYKRAVRFNRHCTAYCGRESWAKGKTKETDKRLKIISEKVSKTQKGKVPWNKGLTKETDKRVANYGKTFSKNNGIKFKLKGPWKNKKLPKHMIDALVEGRKRYYKKYPDAKSRGIKAVNNISNPQRFLYERLKEVFDDVKLEFYFKPYFIDILVNNKIAIEVDGKFWHEGNEEADAYRENDIRKKYKVLRYDSQYVWDNYKKIIKEVVRMS